jgi:hypothetical protein
MRAWFLDDSDVSPSLLERLELSVVAPSHHRRPQLPPPQVSVELHTPATLLVHGVLPWLSGILLRLLVAAVFPGDLLGRRRQARRLPAWRRSGRRRIFWSLSTSRRRSRPQALRSRSNGKVTARPTQASRSLSWPPYGPTQHCAGRIHLNLACNHFFFREPF